MNLAKIDLLTLPSLPLANRSELPNCPAIYFVLKDQIYKRATEKPQTDNQLRSS
jgi:hypothetical protein